MNCPTCGLPVPQGSTRCEQCGATIEPTPPPAHGGGAPAAPGYGGGPPTPREDVPSYLAYAILVTLFCCPLLGIPAIVYAARVPSKLASGDIEGAKRDSRAARNWVWASVLVVVAGWVVYGLFMLFAMLFGAMGA